MTVLSRMFADQRRRWLGFTIGIAAVILIYLPLFESASQSGLLGAKLDALPDSLVEALNFTNVSSAAGYAQATIYGLIGMLILVAFAVGSGAWAIAGDEESGALELTMAHGVDRTNLLLQRALALLTMTAVTAVVAGALVAVVSVVSNLDLSATGITAATLALGALGLFFGSIALLVGAVSGRRALALSITGVVAVFAYLCNSILARTSAGGLFEAISPFHWAYGNDPLVNGLSLPGIGLLLGFSVAFVAVALSLFDRRDVGV